MNTIHTPEFIQYATQQVSIKYLGQNVFFDIQENEFKKVSAYSCHFNYSKDNGYLQLRSIEDISDVESMQVAKICYKGKSHHTKEVGGWIICAILDNETQYINPLKIGYALQYLLQSGFALPIGVLYKDEWFELDLNWQQEKGIIKIK